MKKTLNITYTISTILIIIGAFLILEDNFYGIIILTLGILFNVLYRYLTLDLNLVKKPQWLEILRGFNILFTIVVLTGFYLDWEQKINLLIVAIVLDLLLNLKEVSFKKR